jgi:hypothetical protein
MGVGPLDFVMALLAVIELAIFFHLKLTKEMKVMVTIQTSFAQPDVTNEARLLGILRW